MKSILSILIFSLALSPLSVDVYGQVVRLDNPDQFGERAVLLSFGLPAIGPDGVDLGAVFDRWGVSFRAFGGNRLELRSFTVVGPGLSPPGFFHELQHIPSSAETDGPLSIDLGGAASRIALAIESNAPDVTLRAFTPDGQLLGSVQPELDPQVTFFGVETADPRGIGMVVLESGEADPVERVSSLMVEFLETVSGFSVFVPQIGFGAIGGAVLDTRLDLVNLSNQEAEATIHLFRNDGSPMSTVLAPDGEISVSLDSFRAASFVLSAGTTLEAAARVGYARIDSSQPLEAAAVYTTRGADGALLGEAGIGSAIEQFNVSGFAEKRVAEDTNTGLAVVNTGARTVELKVGALDSESQPPATRTLQPGAQVALFLDELVPALQGRDFSGTVVLRADGPIAVALLQTRAGAAVASVPLGGLLQQRIR